MTFTRLEYAPHSTREAGLRDALSACLDTEVAVRFWRSGADYGAYLVTGHNLPAAVLRVPHVERTSTSYDGAVDFSAMVEREVEVHRRLREAGIPCPEVLVYDVGRDVVPWSWMLSTLIEHEPVDALDDRQRRELGAVAAAIHRIRVPPESPLRSPAASWAQHISGRLGRRLAELARYVALPGDTSAWEELVGAHVGEPGDDGWRLLHMDLRADNICVRDGRIVGLLDMTNALAGDPGLEIGRLRAYGLLDQMFEAGYGALAARQAPLAVDVYSLDTTAMLALLAREELADRAMFEHHVTLTRATLERLLDG